MVQFRWLCVVSLWVGYFRIVTVPNDNKIYLISVGISSWQMCFCLNDAVLWSRRLLYCLVYRLVFKENFCDAQSAYCMKCYELLPANMQITVCTFPDVVQCMMVVFLFLFRLAWRWSFIIIILSNFFLFVFRLRCWIFIPWSFCKMYISFWSINDFARNSLFSHFNFNSSSRNSDVLALYLSPFL